MNDRNYFNAIYFREVGHILYEIVADVPGFTYDESFAMVGEKLLLLAQYVANREKLMDILIVIKVREA